MFYSPHMGGWIWPAENRAVPKLLRDEHVMPYPLTWCPFCFGALPDESPHPVKHTPNAPTFGEGEE